MIKHTARITLGLALVTIGLIGGLIPIFQGWIFGLPGLIILADYFPPIKKLVEWGKKRYMKKQKNDHLQT
tara:strand:+ start:329 stop:538 length:210 start_codon:yes stop_codon:yes gene_type:complete